MYLLTVYFPFPSWGISIFFVIFYFCKWCCKEHPLYFTVHTCQTSPNGIQFLGVWNSILLLTDSFTDGQVYDMYFNAFIYLFFYKIRTNSEIHDEQSTVWNCPSYPLQHIFSYFCTLRCYNLSSGFLSSSEGICVCEWLFKLMFLWEDEHWQVLSCHLADVTQICVLYYLTVSSSLMVPFSQLGTPEQCG